MALAAGACTYGQAVTTLATPPTPATPTTSSPVPAFDAQTFLGDHFDELVDDNPALVVILPDPNSFDLERAVNALPELNGYTVEYVIPFSVAHGLQPPDDDLVAVGLWAAYEDTDVQQWIDYLDDRFGVLAAGRGVQEFGLGSSSEEWVNMASLEVSPMEFWLEASDRGVLIVTSSSAWLLRPGEDLERVDHPENWTLDNFRIVAAGNRFVAFADGENPMILESDTWKPANPLPSADDRMFGTAYIDGRFFAVTAPGRNGGDAGSVFELNFESGEWLELSTVPEAINVGDVVAAAGSIIVSGTRQDGNNLMQGDTQPGVHLFDVKTSTWETLPDAPIHGQAASVGSIGPYLLAWNYDMEWSLLPLDGGNAWSRPQNVPMDQMECYPRTISGSDFAIADFCDQLALFTKGEWFVIPRRPGSMAVTNSGIWNAYETVRGRLDVFYFDYESAGLPAADSG